MNDPIQDLNTFITPEIGMIILDEAFLFEA